MKNDAIDLKKSENNLNYSPGPSPLPISSVRENTANAVPLTSGIHTFYRFCVHIVLKK